MDKGKIPIAIFLEFSKAFDSLSNKILPSKLSYYGVNPQALKLLKSYKTDRKQFVHIHEHSSSLVNPQRSILGPILFVIYINDIVDASLIFDIIIYADDTTLVHNLNDSSNIELNSN